MKLLSIVLMTLALWTVESSQAQTSIESPCYGGCNPASRHPFAGFWVSNTQGSRSLWFPGGDVGAAFATDMANLNTWYRSLTDCRNKFTIISTTPLGSAPFESTGGSWRSVHATRVTVLGGVEGETCFGQFPGATTHPASIGGICNDRLNINNAKTGTDDACYCPVGMDWSSRLQACIKTLDRWHFGEPPQQCKASNPGLGNPLYPLTGSKRQHEALEFSIGRDNAALVFDSMPKVEYAPGSDLSNGSPVFALAPPRSLPGLWSTTLHKALVFKVSQSIQAYRGAGQWVSFTLSGSSYVADPNVSDRLQTHGTGWRYYDQAKRAVETYDGQGRILSTRYSGGGGLSYTYSTASTPIAQAASPGLLIAITDDKSRSVSLSYDARNRLRQLTTPGNATIDLTYDAVDNLAQLTWSDGSTRGFLYERTDLPWALTGVVPESGRRGSVFSYDTKGLAVGTARSAGPGLSVDAYNVNYGASLPAWTVVETDDLSAGIVWRDHYFNSATSLSFSTPTGASSSMAGMSVIGSPRLTSQSQAAGSGCAASVSSQSYDANGNLSSRDDFNGNRVCYANDLARNLEITRVEGLAGGAACAATAPGAALPVGVRKISSLWHPDWPLLERKAEPGRITNYVYNGQPDPFAGGALARCAPSSATLPDGKPIVVVCRQVEQASSDVDGALGFAAPLQPGVPTREQRWTYNEDGQVLTHDGPRTDVADITTHEYYSDTVFTGTDPFAVGHTRGDLRQSTGPGGHVTRYTLHNKAGQLLEMIDPNDVVTSHTYDLRQRLTSTTVAGQTTRFSYWPTGLIQRITQPDDSWTHHEYDDALRLIKLTDNLGNSISYTLDSMGNRTAEDVRDPAGALRRQLARGIDALGRVQLVTGRE